VKPNSTTTIDPQPLAGAIDLNELQSVAVLCVPAGSTVLVAGSSGEAIARALSARMCRVWAIENDPDAARAAAPWCECMLAGNLQTLDLQTALHGERCDAILILNGLERSLDAASLLRRVSSLLAPGGRIVLGVPDVVDGKETDDADRAFVYEVLRHAGLAAIDDIPLRDMRSLLIAAPSAEPSAEMLPALAGAVMEQLQRLEREYQRLDVHARELESRLATEHAANDDLRAALAEAREWHRRSAESVTAGAGALRRELRERERLEEQLAGTAQELEQCRVEQRFLRDDLAVKDAYLASLREENARHAGADRQRELVERERLLEREQWEQAQEAQRVLREHAHEAERGQWNDRARALAARLDTAVFERDRQTDRVVQLEAAHERLQQELAAAHQELHRVHVAVADTLAQPRYVLANRVNAWARRFRILHRPLKRLWLGRRFSDQ
jgi:SAM-dependent methyltransferase